MEMTPEQAERYAKRIVEWLGPYCSRIEVAGSVRRKRPVCQDVDVVCIPKLESAGVDLLGAPTGLPKSLLREFLISYVRETNPGPAGQKLAPNWREGTEPGPAAVNFLLKLRGCDLDVFAANERTWASRLVCRTGSKEHNIFLCERARELGMKWEPQQGLSVARTGLCGTPEAEEEAGELLETASEEEFYGVLGLEVIPVELREGNELQGGRWERWRVEG